MNAPTTTSESRALAAAPAFTLQPQSFEEAWRMAQAVASTDLCPKDYQGKPERCMVAFQWGDEIGLKPMQSLQNIAVINGRPALWGDAMLALVRSSPLCEYFIEKWEGSGETLKAVCRTKRRGEPEEQVREFSMADARQANLLNRDTYKQYGKRMLQMRARGWLIRDVYTDLIRGLHMAEEAMDMPPPGTVTQPADVVGAPAPQQQVQFYPQDKFDKNFPEWEKVLKKGRKTHDEMIAWIESGPLPLSEEQKRQIRAVQIPTDATPKNAPAAEPQAANAPSAAPAPASDTDPFTPPSYAQVADRIAKAKSLDELNTAGDLIKHVQCGPELRAELQQKFDAREQELNA